MPHRTPYTVAASLAPRSAYSILSAGARRRLGVHFAPDTDGDGGNTGNAPPALDTKDAEASLDALVGWIGTDDRKAEAVRALMQKKAHATIFQPISNIGFGAGEARAKKALEAANAELATAKREAEEARTAAKGTGKTAEEIERIRTESAAKVKAAEDALATERETYATEKVTLLKNSTRDRAAALLRDKGLLAPVARAYAIELVADQYHVENGVGTIMQGAGSTLPLSVAAGQDPLEVWASNVRAKATAGELASGQDAGGAAGGGSSNSGGGSAPRAGDYLAQIKADQDAKNKAAAESVSGTSLAQAFGRRPAA